MTDKREEMYDRWWYAPAYISRVCCALPDMKASIPNIHAHEVTRLLVEAGKAYSCRCGCWFVSFH
jgi:hypothetical protein